MRSIGEITNRQNLRFAYLPQDEQREKARRLSIDRSLRIGTERLRQRAKAYFDAGDEAGVVECLAAIEALNAEPVRHHRVRVAELRRMAYHEYLLSEEWQETRRRALERALFRCQSCDRRDGLQVHHRTYERVGEESADDLLVLCEVCHARVHAK